MSDLNKDEYDRNIAIVRSMKGKSYWIEQMDVLSPSKALFFEYRRLADAGAWNQEAFDEIYVPRFIEEMRADAPRAALNQLYKESKEGKRIALACFCTDEAMCHRSIIAGFLQGAGADVETKTGSDYSRYFKMLKGL